MEESVKQIIPVVIAVIVAVLLVAFVKGDFTTTVNDKLEAEVEKITDIGD